MDVRCYFQQVSKIITTKKSVYFQETPVSEKSNIAYMHSIISTDCSYIAFESSCMSIKYDLLLLINYIDILISIAQRITREGGDFNYLMATLYEFKQ